MLASVRSQPPKPSPGSTQKPRICMAPRHYLLWPGCSAHHALNMHIVFFPGIYSPVRLVAMILIPSSLDSTSRVTHLSSCEPPDHPGQDKAGLGSLAPQIRKQRQTYQGNQASDPSFPASETPVLVTQGLGIKGRKTTLEPDSVAGKSALPCCLSKAVHNSAASLNLALLICEVEHCSISEVLRNLPGT